jgi:hypothetical protein
VILCFVFCATFCLSYFYPTFFIGPTSTFFKSLSNLCIILLFARPTFYIHLTFYPSNLCIRLLFVPTFFYPSDFLSVQLMDPTFFLPVLLFYIHPTFLYLSYFFISILLFYICPTFFIHPAYPSDFYRPSQVLRVWGCGVIGVGQQC